MTGALVALLMPSASGNEVALLGERISTTTQQPTGYVDDVNSGLNEGFGGLLTLFGREHAGQEVVGADAVEKGKIVSWFE